MGGIAALALHGEAARGIGIHDHFVDALAARRVHFGYQAAGQLRAHYVWYAADADVLRVHATDRVVEQWVAHVVGIVHAQHAGVMAVLLASRRAGSPGCSGPRMWSYRSTAPPGMPRAARVTPRRSDSTSSRYSDHPGVVFCQLLRFRVFQHRAVAEEVAQLVRAERAACCDERAVRDKGAQRVIAEAVCGECLDLIRLGVDAHLAEVRRGRAD